MHASNRLSTGPLLWGMLVRGPRVISDAFGAPSPGMSATAVVAVLALGLYALCAGLEAHGSALLAGIVGLIVALYAACAVGIAATIAAGDVTRWPSPGCPRTQSTRAARCFAASAVRSCCTARTPISNMSTWAWITDCVAAYSTCISPASNPPPACTWSDSPGPHDVRWAGRRRSISAGSDSAGLATTGRQRLPPPAIASLPVRSVAVDAAVPGDQALIIAQPYAPWMIPPQIDVTANGIARAGRARRRRRVYACRDCVGAAAVA